MSLTGSYFFFRLLLLAPFFGVTFQPLLAQERIGLPDNTSLDSLLNTNNPDLLSDEVVASIADSIQKTDTANSLLAQQLKTYLSVPKLDAGQLFELVDSLLDVETVPAVLLHRIKVAQMQLATTANTTPAPDTISPAQIDSIPAVDGDTLQPDSLPPPASFGFSSVEVRPGLDFAAIELRILGELFPRAYFYSWTRSRAYYDGTSDNFNIVDLYYNFAGGFFFVQETQIQENLGIDLRYGAQWFKRWGNFSLILLTTASFKDYRSVEVLSQWRYFPQITPKLSGVLYFETLSIFDKQGHLGSGERIRLGLLKNGYQVGLANDFIELGSELEFSTIPSLFVVKRF